MSDWVMQFPSMVFTRIKAQFPEKIKTQYGMTDKNFSTVSSANKSAVFPFVYVRSMPSMPIGEDLERNFINGMDFYFQIDVFDNQTQNRAKTVMTEVVKIMVSMGFQPRPSPAFEDQDNPYRMTARFQRKFDAKDIL